MKSMNLTFSATIIALTCLNWASICEGIPFFGSKQRTTSTTTSSSSTSYEYIPDEDRTSLLSELITAASSSSSSSNNCNANENTNENELNTENSNNNEKQERIQKAIQEYSPTDGPLAWSFLSSLASSFTFREKYWHIKPLLLRSHEITQVAQQQQQKQQNDDKESSSSSSCWVAGSFTIKNHLRLVDQSYISGHKTDDILRNGTKTDTWAFQPLKKDPSVVTTWKDVSEALQGGTIYFNNGGSLWPTLGAFCRLTNYAFGLPTNVNIYVTPPGSKVSVPPHTDRQDVIVFQTEGSKRWRVYNPPLRKEGCDPLNRGKGGDVIHKEELGEPLLDVILRKGDVMYVPLGFPHTTDTSTELEEETIPPTVVNNKKDGTYQETSVHLTMGLDTFVWALTYAHLRWTVLQRQKMNWRVKIKDDQAYWDSMNTVPVGFLSTSSDSIPNAIEELKRILIQLEPERWEAEDLPPNDAIEEVLRYTMDNHVQSLLDIHDDMFSGIDPRSEQTLLNAYHGSQRENKVMEEYGKFSTNEGMRTAFEQRRLEREQRVGE